ncbi:MAG: hypothetical protein OEW58_01085 [Gammaproteobacteria bacterium]|nr:hypothetical protein [Gammaproteobacteria bacterium]
MKKKWLVVALVASAGVSQSALAEGWTFLAGSKEGYKAEPIASVLYGSMDIDGTSGAITGVEMSLNCPLLQPPTNRIRQQASITTWDESGAAVTNIEINPHYVVKVADDLEVGGGVGFGYMLSDDIPDQLGFQIGASVHYTGLPVFVGAEWRMQTTSPADPDAPDVDADNTRWAVKVGYAF